MNSSKESGINLFSSKCSWELQQHCRNYEVICQHGWNSVTFCAVIVTIVHRLQKWESIQETESFVNSHRCSTHNRNSVNDTTSYNASFSLCLLLQLLIHCGFIALTAFCWSLGAIKRVTSKLHIYTKEGMISKYCDDSSYSKTYIYKHVDEDSHWK